MSLISWMSRRMPSGAQAPSSGLAPEEPSRPAHRKQQRLLHRERLYTVVRESMNRAGVLSSSYKFKVLSLDKHGTQFLVMIDLAGHQQATSASLAEIEAVIAQAARARDGVLVKAVYWRRNDQVAVGLQGSPLCAPSRGAEPASAAVASHGRTAFDPIDAQEVADFRQALASGMKRPTRAASPDRNDALLTGFEETQLNDHQRPPALSTSQYGDLN